MIVAGVPRDLCCRTMATVFLNGEFVDGAEARVSAFDAGLTHAVGVFETMSARVVDGEAEVVRVFDHLDRLADSAKALRLSDDLRKPALAEAIKRTAEKCGLARQRIRLTVTGGDLNPVSAARTGVSPHDPTVMIVAQAATEYPEEMFEQGVAVGLADYKANPFDPTSAHKTLNYWARLSALQSASTKGMAESLVFQVTNHLAGGCVSNAIIVKDGELLTPIVRGEEAAGGLPSPVLPGITRAEVLEIARREGLETTSRMLTIDDVLEADELMLTNSSWGVLPIVRVEASVIGGGVVGEVTKKLREKLDI